jgi:hypothetical protein
VQAFSEILKQFSQTFVGGDSARHFQQRDVLLISRRSESFWERGHGIPYDLLD